MTDAQAPVLAEVRNRVGHLTLNRPAGLNALTLEIVRLLQGYLNDWSANSEVKAVVLRGNGDRAFCAGGDIRTLYDQHLAGDAQAIETFFAEEYALDLSIHAFPKPVIALMDGFVLGGGMGLAQGASLRILTERSKLGMPETGIGYFPDVGGSYFLPRLPGEMGLYLGITGTQVNTADALHLQLADLCIPSKRLAELDQVLDHINWENDSLDMALTALVSTDLPPTQLADLQPAIDLHFAQPTLSAIHQSLLEEIRPAYTGWAQSTVQLMDSRSPLAMAVTLELLRRGRGKSLEDCFAMELHLDRQWFNDGDIAEGVRALLVDKDKQPRWNPPSIGQLEPARVNAFFEGLS
ncbi:enoyl-CoA hydratase/isomerase family protein [Halopseudomonas pelagia]|uniref:enoyl-CoA hydratase/isomerase family protein n=1 Tax=Halopseudomonas pelagia TaxID=553151 RepID=UPI0030D89BAE|tara:strand:- start:16 stop:1068 length:1053 start_codon:yes stop_codon:yes gene_type:complete